MTVGPYILVHVSCLFIPYTAYSLTLALTHLKSSKPIWPSSVQRKKQEVKKLISYDLAIAVR